jgi:hypothetical protein
VSAERARYERTVIWVRWASLLLLATGCRDYAALCGANDPSVDAETCWNKGRVAGYNAGMEDVYASAYDSGYAACAAEDTDAR